MSVDVRKLVLDMEIVVDDLQAGGILLNSVEEFFHRHNRDTFFDEQAVVQARSFAIALVSQRIGEIVHGYNMLVKDSGRIDGDSPDDE